ncbi:flagellar hook-associated protein FlgK [Parendozoicomonas sp. Alg238-R29]|uniref:flagellar hook-associated protein FlgK n=1 Tax=Parendozoicomonas sp. Alg238-R29 TaxID=2993446 RepID=UPI00248DBDE9|nr:flagellar hook-associated protein FlgK [Parendozoicomonas sp. Alg238-R29]
MSSLLNIGQSALTVGRSNLDNTAQNVSNTLTEWYSRRENVLESVQTHGGGHGVLASGVTVTEVRRITDAFVTTRVWYTSGQYQQAKTMDSYMHQLDGILGGENTGYSQPLNQLHRSFQRAAVTPEALAVRQQVLGDANLAVMQLVTLQERFQAFHEQMEVQVESLLAEVNQLAENIATVNDRIRTATIAGSDTGDLQDTRNRLVDHLSELTGAKVTESGSSNMIDVVLAEGTALVTGNKSFEFVCQKSNNGNKLSVTASSSGSGSELDVSQWGGVLGGIAGFYQVLMREQNVLGVQSALLTGGSNRVLSEGFGLDDTTGNKLFRELNDPAVIGRRIVRESAAGNGQLELTVDDSKLGDLKASDYRLEFTSPTEGTVTRLTDKHVYTFLNLATPFEFDGLSLSLTTGTPATGDKYLLTPWRYEAGNAQVVLSDPKKLGFASPDSSDPSKSQGSGDNSNLGKLLDYFDGEGLSSSLSVTYDRQVSRIATDARQATSREQAELSLRDSARAERDNLSGVNLDEEAANLIRFQQYYQANVRVIATGNVVIDELLTLF